MESTYAEHELESLHDSAEPGHSGSRRGSRITLPGCPHQSRLFIGHREAEEPCGLRSLGLSHVYSQF
jgi:hypothetical protein